MNKVFPNYSERVGIASSGIFYNVQRGTAA